MEGKDFLKLILFITGVGVVSFFLFYSANNYYLPDEKDTSVTNLYLINSKDTIVMHDTIVNVKWKSKIVKICCCGHDSIACSVR